MVRRSVAFGAGLLVLILLVLGFRACLDNRNESAINDYVRDVDALMRESDQQGEALFQQLEGGSGGSDVEIENALNGYRSESEQLVDRARDLDPPDDMKTAQQYVVETLALRSEGIREIADQLPNALAGGDQREGAAERIAAAMQAFLASDQIYFRRALPAINEVLEEEGLEGDIVASTFLKDLDWLDPAEVASRIGGISDGGGGDAAPGLHGNGLGAVTLGGQTLVAGDSVSIPLSGDLAFDVQVMNQGENTETDVPVKVTVGSGSDAIELDGVLDTIAAGETKPVTIQLDKQPPTGQNIPIKVEIEPVPGEEKTDNNVGEFAAIFTS